ncbi:hypothetical protein GOP47_0003929 [Adiantum capillus-veneris]|uniref:DNA-dependent protein kinase catalytic subunit n=1 Tax=Adiantum capillus-veneris TaxID=13818 RepID=A0A9D4V6J5_ADICA|nr:hypothetical protein GOP47_0003929 [Adiantum capillus-veneris]
MNRNSQPLINCTYYPLAEVAMDALDRWITYNRCELESFLDTIVPYLNHYLSINMAASTVEDESFHTGNLENRSVLFRRIQRERKERMQPDPFQHLQLRILKFLGRIGKHAHSLVPDVNLLQIVGVGGLAWGTTDQLRFILPFRDDKTDAWLDSLLPRIVDLALTASDRSTKVGASELLHAMCLLMIGNAAKGPSHTQSGERPSVHYENLYRRIFPAVVRLAADVEQVTRDLFSRLVMQMIHWFTSNVRKENPDTMALLDAILDGLVDSDNASLREFCADCYEEFLRWSIRHAPPEVDNFVNVTSMLRRLYNRLDHPNPYHRLGSAMACSRLYRVMRDNKSIVDRHLLEMFFFCIKSLRIAENDIEQIGTIKQVCKVLDDLQRLLKRNISILAMKRKDRAMFTTLDDFLDWLFKQTIRPQDKCRGRCMYLLSSILQSVKDVPTTSSWLQSLVQSKSLDRPFFFFNTKLSFIQQIKGRLEIESLEQEMRSLTRSMHWCDWALRTELVALEDLSLKTSNLFDSINEFLKSFLHTHNSKVEGLLTLMEFERYEKVRCRAVMHFLSFTNEIVCSVFGIREDEAQSFGHNTISNPEMTELIPRLVPINNPEFLELLFSLLLTPQEFGFRGVSHSHNQETLCRLIMKVLKFLTLCCLWSKEKVIQCLQDFLAQRSDLDLGNLIISGPQFVSSSCSQMESFKYLLRGYQQLLLAGILLPVLGKGRSSLTAEKLLTFVFSLSSGCSSTLEALASDILSLSVSLGIKIDRLLELVFDQTPLSNSSSESAGSVFYMRFRKVLIQKVKFFYKESLSLLLKKAPENSTARLVVNALLDDYLGSRTEGNVITVKSFLNEFVNQMAYLVPCCSSDAPYSDKLFFLEVLYKLLMLDADGQTVLSPTQPSFHFVVDRFYSLLGGSYTAENLLPGNAANRSMNLVVQNSALSLIPHFLMATSAHLFVSQISSALMNIVTNVLLVRETDLPPGSTQRATYLQTLDRLLAAVCSSKTPQLLEVLFPILQNCIPLARKRLVIALRQFANSITDQRPSVCSACLQALHDRTKLPTLKRAITELILIPILEDAPVDFLRTWFAEHIKDFFLTISKKHELEEQQNMEREEDFLVVKSCSYMIISCLFMNATAAVIRDTITPLVSNQQLMQVATNDSRAKNDPPLYHFTENISLWRDVHVQAYNCLAAIVMCTQDQEKIFTILFKDFAGRPLWQHLIDCKQVYDNFPVEISQLGSLQDVTRNLRADRKSKNRLDGTSPPPLFSQYVIGATLSQEPSLIDSFVGGTPHTKKESLEYNETNEDAADAEHSFVDTDLTDQDDFDKHPSFQMVLKTVSHLHAKFEVSGTQEMPEWMKALHSTLSNSGTAMNISLFIIKVVIKARRIFQPFGSAWMLPILQPFLRHPESSGGNKFHYILRDVCVMILEWNLPNCPDKDVASRFLNHLFQMASHESNQVVRANLEIIHQFLASWKDCVTLDTGIIASHITAGGKNPSATDKAVSMHKVVGLQLFGAMLSVGLNPCDNRQIPEKDLIKALLFNLSFRVKAVYESSAELLGMLLQKQKDVSHDQSLETGLKQVLLVLFKEGETGQFLTIMDKITLHCPSFFEGYSSMIFDLLPRVHGVFRVLSLSIILRCPSAIPNLFSLVLPFLSKMLAHRDEIAQLKSLQLVAELVKDADKKVIIEQVLPNLYETFSTHDSVECRKRYYDILIFLFTTKEIADDAMLIRSLLQGLCDDSSLIRESLQSFWHKHLSGDPRRRLLETITRIYDPLIEDHWVHVANSLLLKLCEEAVDFRRPIFNAPLSDCEFKEYTLDTSLLSGTLPMTPMFLDSQGASSQFQTQGNDDDNSIHPIRHPHMIRATMSQSQTLESSEAGHSFSTFMTGEGESSLFALSRRQNRRSFDSSFIPGPQAQGNISAALKKRMIHPSASRPQILRSVLNTMKRREARMAQQAVERANKVHILRQYRIGDLPDIEIKHEEIIRPLAALAEKDSTFSRLLLQVLFCAIYAISPDQYIDGEHDLKTLVTRAIENAFEKTQNNISFISSALSLCLQDKDSWIKPSLIGSVSTKSTNFQSGILYLENAIVKSSAPWQYLGNARKRHKGSQGQVTTEPNTIEQAWLELANLYRSIGENDIVLSIYKKHLTKANITHCALEAELEGESVRALRMYDKAIDQFNEMEGESVVPNDVEQDLWYTRRLHCLANLLNWQAVMDEILFQVEESLDRLWEPRVQDSYLSLFIRAAIKIPTHHSKLSEFIQPLSDDSWKKTFIMKEFSTQVTTLAVSDDQFDRARFFIHECYKSFLKHWAEFHPLASSARRLQIIKLQKTTELSEFLENIANYQLNGLLRLMSEWRDRWPSSAMDDAEAWDDIVQNRLLFYQKMQSAFNHRLEKGKEEEGVNFAHQLDDERAHVYYAASKGLMKQGSFEAAKNYMNQFVALHKDKLDFSAYKNIIKLRCLEADRVSRTDLQKASDMLQQVIGYMESTSKRHEKKNWQIGLKLLQGSAYSQLGLLTLKLIPRNFSSAHSIDECLQQLGSGFTAFSDGLLGMNKGQSEVSSRTLAKAALKFAFFCDELLKSVESSKWGSQIQEAMKKGRQAVDLPPASTYPNLMVKHVMQAVQLDCSLKAHHGIARVLTLVGHYIDTSKEFVSAAKDIPRWIFIPWIPQMLSSLDKDDGENYVDILEDIAKLYPQAIYFAYNVSKLDFTSVGCSRATRLESILKSPVLETLVRGLEDLTFPEQRLRDGLSFIKNLLEGGNREKAKSYLQSLFYDSLDIESMTKENRGSGEYNLKFAREYSKRVVDAVGLQGAKLLSMNDKQFTQATSAIMANLQKAIKSLPSGNLSLNLFSKWMADFDSSRDMWISQEDSETSGSLMSTIDVFGSYNSFRQPDPSSLVKVVSFDQTIFSLSSKQRPKVLKVRGSDELEYKFIVKGGEDLRLDQRIEQLFEMMNAILHRDPSCSKRKLSIRTYAVIPVSRQCGLLQYVENTRSLDDIVKDGLATILPSLGVTGKVAPGEVTSNIRLKFHEWLEKRGGSQNVVDCYRNMYAKVQYNEMVEKMSGFVSALPWDTLKTALFKLTTSAESFLALRAQYQRSLAVLSICGYVAGVGDRHLGNILVDVKGGALVPIDFGYSFGTGDGIGLLRNDMILIMNALHDSKDTISAVMDVFVKEPLVDWKTEAMKTASWRNSGPAAFAGQASHEQQHVALKVEFAQRKLDLWNPADITCAELQSSVHTGKSYMPHLQQIVQGQPDRNLRARITGNVCESVQEQVDCLIDQATDVNLLGRVWLGWQPWI